MDTPGYYAIITAEIRYAKDLTNLQKLLYAELTALSNKSGFAFPSNKYLAELYGKHETYISQAISDMNKKGYIDVFVDCKTGNDRKIYVGGIQKNLKTSLEKPKDPSLEKPKDNNTSNNNKNNRASNFSNSSAVPLSEETTYEPIEEKLPKSNREITKKIRARAGMPPLKPQKKRKPTPAQNIFLEADAIGKHYLDQTQLIHGIRPAFDYGQSGKNYKLAKSRLKEYGLGQCKEIITFFLNSKKCTELGFDFSIALSSHTVNQYLKNNKKQNAKKRTGLHFA